MVIRLTEDTTSNALDNFMIALKDIPDEDIDHYETDLYLRKTPATTKLIQTILPDSFKKNVTTFIDNIDKVPWYEIPFAFPKERNRRGDFTESVNLPKTLAIEVMSGLRNVPVTDKWPTGKQVWNIGSHNPYIDKGYVIVCNTRDYKIIPETLEFVYVGPENAKALHKRAGRGPVNDKNYTKYLVTDIDLDELVPAIVDNVNKTYRDYIAKYGEPIKESYIPDKYDIERVAELVQSYLKNREYESKCSLYSKTSFCIDMWYVGDMWNTWNNGPHYVRFIYLKDIDWDWTREELEYWAENKAEELDKDYIEFSNL